MKKKSLRKQIAKKNCAKNSQEKKISPWATSRENLSSEVCN